MNTQTKEYGTGKGVALALDSHWTPKNDFSDVQAEPEARSENVEKLDWTIKQYCRIAICPDEDGYYVYAVNLPGAASQGDTVEEATENIREALEGVLEVHLEAREAIPWESDEDCDPIPAGAIEKWIYVNA